jgi:hypothetical protein
VKVDDKTVAKVRTELEATADIPQLEKTVGRDGKARPAHKSAKAPSFKEEIAAAQEPDLSEPERKKRLKAARRAGEQEKHDAQFVTASWRRDADIITIAKAILATLKVEPHTQDIDPLRRALEQFIAPQLGTGRSPKDIADRAERRSAATRAAP